MVPQKIKIKETARSVGLLVKVCREAVIVLKESDPTLSQSSKIPNKNPKSPIRLTMNA